MAISESVISLLPIPKDLIVPVMLLASLALSPLAASSGSLPASTSTLPAHFELAGVYPGLSAAATASALFKAMPGWVLLDPMTQTPSNVSFTDALSNDCSHSSARAWTCQALLSTGEGDQAGLAELTAVYATPTPHVDKDRSLARLRLRLSWKIAQAEGWNSFINQRSTPKLLGPMPNIKAIRGFNESIHAARAAAGASSFVAALWSLNNPDGSPFELAVVGALDARGRLLALAAETGSLPAPPPLTSPAMP